MARVRYSDQQINDVLNYYKNHTAVQTIKYFAPQGIKAGSILGPAKFRDISRKTNPPLNLSSKDMIHVYKLLGLVNCTQIASQLPAAKRCSVYKLIRKKLPTKLFKIQLHCWHVKKAALFCNVKNIEKVDPSNARGRGYYFFVDLEKNIKPDCPIFVKDAIMSLASFQRWLFENEHPRKYLDDFNKNSR